MRALIYIMTPVLILTIILASRFVSWERLKGFDSNADKHLTDGTQLLGKGEFYRSIVELTRAIEIEPKYAEAYINRGRAYYYLAQYKDAIADYTQTISLNQYIADAYASRGDVYRALNDIPRAIDDYTESLKARKNALVLSKRAKCYLLSGKPDEAIRDYTDIVKHRPTAIAYNNRGIAYHKKYLLSDKNDELQKHALADFDKAIEMQPHFAIAYLNRSDIHGDLEQQNLKDADLTKSIELLTEAIDNWENEQYELIPIYLWRAVALKKNNQIDKARNDVKRIYVLFSQFFLNNIKNFDIL